MIGDGSVVGLLNLEVREYAGFPTTPNVVFLLYVLTFF